jgi:hypothetical protein
MLSVPLLTTMFVVVLNFDTVDFDITKVDTKEVLSRQVSLYYRDDSGKKIK